MGAAFVPSVAPPAPPVVRRGFRDDAEPVWTYQEARGWCWRNVDPLDMEAIIQRNAPLPPALRLIASIYWVGEEKLRADLRKTWREAGGAW